MVPLRSAAIYMCLSDTIERSFKSTLCRPTEAMPYCLRLSHHVMTANEIVIQILMAEQNPVEAAAGFSALA